MKRRYFEVKARFVNGAEFNKFIEGESKALERVLEWSAESGGLLSVSITETSETESRDQTLRLIQPQLSWFTEPPK